MSGKTDRFVVRPQLTGEIAHHDMSRARQEMGPSYNYMDQSLVPEADIVVHLTEVRQVPSDFSPYVEPHQHEVSSFYGIVGELTVEVTLDGERHEVTGPASVFIPPGVMHSIRPLRGKGQMIIVLRRGNYE